MKISIAAIVIAAFAGITAAQNTKTINADVSSFDRIVTGSPFTAEGAIESSQILSDGTKILRKSTRKLFRDDEGRLRREEGKFQLGIPGSNIELPDSIDIIDPVAGLKFSLNVKNRDGRKSEFKIKGDGKWDVKKEADWDGGENEAKEQARKEQERQRKEHARQEKERKGQNGRVNKQDSNLERDNEKKLVSNSNEMTITSSANSTSTAIMTNGKTLTAISPSSPPASENPRVESLGTRQIEGVNAVGTRTTTTILAGSIGNDRDFKVVYEKWYSPDLMLTVSSKHDDPRFGEQTYRLTNIRRENPPIELFSPPADFHVSGAKSEGTKPPNVGILPGKPAPPKGAKPGN